MAFQAQIMKSPQAIIISCAGTMDEHMNLPVPSESLPIEIDLGQVSYINSIGVRKWIRWVTDVAKAPRVTLENCPVIFVKNLTTIKGMLGANTQLKSFFVPYYNDELGERQNVLFRSGIEFLDDGRVMPPAVGPGLEMDVVEDIYFSFLRRP